MDALGAIDTPLTEAADQPGIEVSEAIRIARVVCIFFMVFVHVHPGTAEFVSEEAGIRLFDVARFFIVDSLGRASVALLSVVAGYLAVYSLRRESYSVFLQKKTRSLLFPLLLWNLVFVGLVLVVDNLHRGYVVQSVATDFSVSTAPRLLLGLGGLPANEPLSFLRDVFLCALFTPALLIALRKGGTRWLVAAGAALTLLALVTPVGVRPSIPALYTAGVYFAERGHVPRPGFRLIAASVVAFAALAAVLTWGDLQAGDNDSAGLTWLDVGFNVIRLPAAITFWALALALRGSRIGGRLARLEPYIFTAFCSHIIISKVAWLAWQPLFGGYYGALYPVFYFAMPVVVIVCAVAGARFLDANAPALFSLLNGGRGLRNRRRGMTRTPEAGLRLEPSKS